MAAGQIIMTLIAICNFGLNHSLYTNILTLNDRSLKANCNAHILQNKVKLALGKLNVNIENIVLKIYGHFSTSAKRRESLKEFHSFVETEFNEILRHYQLGGYLYSHALKEFCTLEKL